MTTPVSMVVIDDNRLMREGLAAMIHSRPGFIVVAPDVDVALDKVRETKPDVVLLDYGLADHDRLNLTATIRAEVPDARVIVMGVVQVANHALCVHNYVGGRVFTANRLSPKALCGIVRNLGPGFHSPGPDDASNEKESLGPDFKRVPQFGSP